MAYQVISQNNTTTTLADENGNVIHVPARVNLATSTDYKITKVNNTTATLEDGNGNIIRDVPCVAVLYGEGGGGSSLPDQTGHSGEFLTTDGTDASWSDKPLVNKSTYQYPGSLAILGTTAGKNCLAVGYGSGTYGTYQNITACGANAYGYATGSLAVGAGALVDTNKDYGIAMGASAQVKGANAIQINASGSVVQNTDANTFKVANNNGNYEMMNANGNLPADRLASTTGLADGNYKLRLTISSGVPTLSWVAE